MQNEHPKPDQLNPAPAHEDVDQSRRRLAKAGVAAAVLMTVASRSAMAGGAKGCTISAWMSAGSGPVKANCFGRTSIEWKNKFNSWPAPCYSGGYGVGGLGSYTGWSYGSDKTPKFKDVFGSTPPGQNLSKKTLWQVLQDDPAGNKLGAQSVAALLNAADSGIPYGYSVTEVISLYKKNVNKNASGLYNTFKILNERVG